MKKMKVTSLVIVLILLSLTIGFVVNMQGDHPLFKTLLVSTSSDKVIFNNYSKFETIQEAARFLSNGNREKARIVFEDMLEKNPEDVEGLVGIAVCYAYIRNYKKSIEYVNKAEQILERGIELDNERQMQLYEIMAIVYDATSYYEGSKYNPKLMEYAQKVIDMESEDSVRNKSMHYTQYVALFELYMQEEMYDEAIEYCKKAQELLPQNPLLDHTLAILYTDNSDFENAYNSINKVKEYFGDKNEYYLIDMGYYYTKTGEYEKAYDCLKNLEAISPDDSSSLYFYYGKYYEAIGDIENARENYKKSFSLEPYAIFDYSNQNIIQRLNIDISDLAEKMEEEKRRDYASELGDQT